MNKIADYLIDSGLSKDVQVANLTIKDISMIYNTNLIADQFVKICNQDKFDYIKNKAGMYPSKKMVKDALDTLAKNAIEKAMDEIVDKYWFGSSWK